MAFYCLQLREKPLKNLDLNFVCILLTRDYAARKKNIKYPEIKSKKIHSIDNKFFDVIL